METSLIPQQQCFWHGLIRTVTLDFAREAGDNLKKGLDNLVPLTALSTITIYPPRSHDGLGAQLVLSGILDNHCPCCTFIGLRKIKFANRQDQRKQRARRLNSNAKGAEIARREDMLKDGSTTVYDHLEVATLRMSRALGVLLQHGMRTRWDRFAGLNAEMKAVLLRRASDKGSSKHSSPCGKRDAEAVDRF
ncbi:hypothetical protein LTR85_007281 [Meristemomyces frigidus]|nr:hypothetical protein LTR85_007281 [Meristemomyces frigidus]